MKVKALISFSGAVSMTQGQTMQMEEGEVLTGLLSCGYVEEMEEKKSYLGIDLSNTAFKAVIPDAEPPVEGDVEPPLVELGAEPSVEPAHEVEPEKKTKKTKSKAVDADEGK